MLFSKNSWLKARKRLTKQLCLRPTIKATGQPASAALAQDDVHDSDKEAICDITVDSRRTTILQSATGLGIRQSAIKCC